MSNNKNTETELKYLVKSLPSDLPHPLEIDQIYFDGSLVIDLLKPIFPSLDYSLINTYRVRKQKYLNEETIILTLKTKSIGYTRGEFEKEIDQSLAQSLTQNNKLSEIIKNRYVIKTNQYTFEFDEYLNLKTPLYTSEIEVEEVNESVIKEIETLLRDYFKLDYQDVTHDHRYKNSNLIHYFG